jgi:hypothetical protein
MIRATLFPGQQHIGLRPRMGTDLTISGRCANKHEWGGQSGNIPMIEGLRGISLRSGLYFERIPGAFSMATSRDATVPLIARSLSAIESSADHRISTAPND